MPNIAVFHPQIVHFVIALLIVGVGMRIVSLTGKLRFTSPAATSLILMGTVAAWLAVRSGTDAHGPVERIPGARAAVQEHEEHGKRALQLFYVISAIELVGLGISRKESWAKQARWVYGASALIGLFGCFELFEAGEHGGELVYSYAGGPGLRTGDPEDTKRMLLAALYNESMAERKAGHHAEAAELIVTMARRYPGDTTVQILNAESLMLDSQKYPEALGALNAVAVDPKDARTSARVANLKADIYLKMGQPAQAKSALAAAIAALPAGATQGARLKAKMDSIKP